MALVLIHGDPAYAQTAAAAARLLVEAGRPFTAPRPAGAEACAQRSSRGTKSLGSDPV
jgi:hypothetical protein